MGGVGEGEEERELSTLLARSAHVEDSVVRILFGQSVRCAMMRGRAGGVSPPTRSPTLLLPPSPVPYRESPALSVCLSLSPSSISGYGTHSGTSTNLALLLLLPGTPAATELLAPICGPSSPRIFGSEKRARHMGRNFHHRSAESDEHEIQNSCTKRMGQAVLCSGMF